MLGKSGWLAGALAACLLIFSGGAAWADGGRHHRGHGAYHHKHPGKFGKQVRRQGHRPSWHYGRKYLQRHGPKRFRYRAPKYFGHDRYKYAVPYGFTFYWRLGGKYDGHGARGYRHDGARVSIQAADRPYAVAQALEHAGDGQAIVWNDPETRSAYQVVPTKTYQEPGGRYCREYLTTATVGGRVQDAYGQACRQPDGSWEIIN